MKYVIIGNSAAAAGAIAGIRSKDAKGEIVVISNERHFIYGRPLISYYLQGKTDLDNINYKPLDFYEKNNVQTMLGKTVIKIDKNNKKVILDSTEEVNYDKLLVSTGSSPFVPLIDGLDKVKNKFTFMSLDDATSLKTAVNKNTKVLILGAGLIGLKCAEGLLNLVSKITVVDISKRILSSILDEEGAEFVQKHIENNGVEFLLGKGVKSFAENEAVLDSGETVEFDVLVTAVGVKPNIDIIKEIGAKTERGIITNEYMNTGITDIYAAGDCTESYDITEEKNKILALMPNAYLQGECAGINMAGGSKTFSNAIPMNAIGFMGLHIITAGTYKGEIYSDCNQTQIKKLFYENNKLCGYILVGNVEKAGIYTKLIREQLPLDKINFNLICKKPTYFAFEKNYRSQCFGEVV